MTSQPASNTGSASRRTTGLVTAALLAFSATTAPTSVEAARVSSSNARAAVRRLEHEVPQPADAMFVAGPQCVKCCKPAPTMDEIRQDTTGGGGGGGPPGPPGPPGGSGKGKGKGGPAGRRMMKNRNRRLAARGKDSKKRAQEFRELVRE